MGRPKKNEFSEKVKNLVGRSVGFRCCFPNCNKLLISRKKSTPEIINIAEYAHISAASSGGPRYDPSLTSEEIKSYDNCIVLCGVHHHVVDMNPTEYPVDKLKNWKAIAEERARKEMTISNNYKSSDELEALFSSLFTTGDYNILKTKIDDFLDVSNHIFYEIVIRYKIYLNIIFRKSIHDIIETYVGLGYNNIDVIVLKLIEFDCKDEIKYLYNFINDKKLKLLANDIFSTSTDEIIKNAEIGKRMKQINPKLQIKYIMNYVFSVLNLCCYIYDLNDRRQEFCQDDYYYEFVAFALELREICLTSNNYMSKDIIINKISNYIDMIDKYEESIKIKTYEFILFYLASVNGDMFKMYYNRLSETERKKQNISNIYYGFMIENKCSIEIEEILENSDKINDYGNLLMLLKNNPSIVKEFIEEHKYLLKKNSAFLLLYKDYIGKDEFETIIHNYKEIYVNDFLYNCLLWNMNIDDFKLKRWCIDHEKKSNIFSIGLYLTNLILANENNHFFELIKKIKNIELKANCLLTFNYYNQNNKLYYKYLLNEYIAINESKLIRNVNHNMAIIYFYEEEYEKSIECLCMEIDNFDNLNSLQLLVKIRLLKEQYIMDKYFDKARMTNEYYMLIYVAEVYYHNNELVIALDFYEKALITGIDNNFCLLKIFELTSNKTFEIPNKIDDNTVVSINNNNERKTIVFHRKSIFDGITNANSKWSDACLYTCDYCDFLYKIVGDKVTLSGHEYKIESIENIYTYYSRLFVSELILKSDTVIIKGPIENAIKEMKNLLEQRQHYIKEASEKYIKIKDELPISISAKAFFRDKIIHNLLFILTESQNKLTNNLNIFNGNMQNSIFLFYYDALFVLYEIYDKISFKMPDNYYITDFVKNRINNEINEELNEISLDCKYLDIDSHGDMVIFDRNSKIKNKEVGYLIRFKNFIEKFKVKESKKYVVNFDNQVFENIDFKMEDEKSMLSIADGDKKYIIVSENKALNTYCNLKEIANIGITQIVSEIVPQDEIFTVALLLKNFNYNNYFTYNMYLTARSEKEKMAKFLSQSFDNELDKYKHEAILKAILQQLYELKILDLSLDSSLIDYLLKNTKNN